MTYLFMVIGVGVINSLANKKMSYMPSWPSRISAVIGLAAALENIPFSKREVRETILYEKVDLIRPENHADLVADLQEENGIEVEPPRTGRDQLLARYGFHRPILLPSRTSPAARRLHRSHHENA